MRGLLLVSWKRDCLSLKEKVDTVRLIAQRTGTGVMAMSAHWEATNYLLILGAIFQSPKLQLEAKNKTIKKCCIQNKAYTQARIQQRRRDSNRLWPRLGAPRSHVPCKSFIPVLQDPFSHLHSPPPSQNCSRRPLPSSSMGYLQSSLASVHLWEDC